VRPSASKPLEVETLRKYNADGETCLFSPHLLFSPSLSLALSLFLFDFSFLSRLSPYARCLRMSLSLRIDHRISMLPAEIDTAFSKEEAHEYILVDAIIVMFTYSVISLLLLIAVIIKRNVMYR